MRPPGSPRTGDLAGFIERPRGSAPRERDHRGGDHPVPSRTRQLSPPSPRVLQRKAAGGQGVALAEGAFLYARARRMRRMRRERPAGGCPPAGLFAFPGPDRGPHHRRRGPPTWPAFDASGACVPREWIDCFVSADGMTIARFCRGYSCFWGNSAFSLDRFPRNLGPRVRSSSRVSLILGLLLAWGAVDRVATRFLRRRYRR